MSYFITEIKKFYKSKIIIITLVIMLLIALSDPIIDRIFIQGSSGGNSFLYWILQPASFVGRTVYHATVYIIPVIFTGLIYCSESNSSVLAFSMIKVSRTKYFFTKLISLFTVAFFNCLIFLSLNLLFTCIIYSPNAAQTEQYTHHIPMPDTFAYFFYQINPFVMSFFYILLNAYVIAVLTVTVLDLHMIFKFGNPFVAFLVPVFIFEILSFVGSIILPANYQLSYVIQPAAASMGSEITTSANLIALLLIYSFAALILFFIGMKRNEDII